MIGDKVHGIAFEQVVVEHAGILQILEIAAIETVLDDVHQLEVECRTANHAIHGRVFDPSRSRVTGPELAHAERGCCGHVILCETARSQSGGIIVAESGIAQFVFQILEIVDGVALCVLAGVSHFVGPSAVVAVVFTRASTGDLFFLAGAVERHIPVGPSSVAIHKSHQVVLGPVGIGHRSGFRVAVVLLEPEVAGKSLVIDHHVFDGVGAHGLVGGNHRFELGFGAEVSHRCVGLCYSVYIIGVVFTAAVIKPQVGNESVGIGIGYHVAGVEVPLGTAAHAACLSRAVEHDGGRSNGGTALRQPQQVDEGSHFVLDQF